MAIFSFRSTSRFGASLLFLAVPCLGYGQQAASPAQKGDADSAPPLDIKFQPSRGLLGEPNGGPSCGVPKGRLQVYDPETGVFHIHFRPQNFSASAFTVTKAAGRFTKPVVFSLTGVPRAYGCLGVPLALSVGGKGYALEEGALAPGRVDQALVRVERKADRVRVEFTERGRALLKAGAEIAFKVDTGW